MKERYCGLCVSFLCKDRPINISTCAHPVRQLLLSDSSTVSSMQLYAVQVVGIAWVCLRGKVHDCAIVTHIVLVEAEWNIYDCSDFAMGFNSA